jgi:hypothetical protein
MIPTCYGEQRPRLFNLLAKEYDVRKNRGEKAEALEEAVELMMRAGTGSEPERLQTAVETLSGNRNTVVFDDAGLPSVMVRVPALREKDVLLQGSDALHPAFSAVGELLVAKYQSSMLEGHACSLPMVMPTFGLSFDEAVEHCRNKGSNWHLMPFSLRMAIALHCRRRGFLPHGNSRDGRSYLFPDETGITEGGSLALCGSGPVTWAHDGTADGIYDLNGNLNEWDAGLRLMDGEIQTIPAEALFAPDADLGPNSPLWKAVLETGALVDPGMPGTLKFDAPQGRVRLTRSLEYPGLGNDALRDVTAEPGLTPPMIMRLLGLYPEDDRQGYELGWRWISTQGETIPLCGGAYRADDHAGVFFAGMTYPRTKDYELTGFRFVYRNGR